TSAWASQRRTDSRETPSWRATAAVAAVRVGYSWACSRTSRTHLARSWGSIFHGCLSILSDSNSSGIKPGPIQGQAVSVDELMDLRREPATGTTQGVVTRLVAEILVVPRRPLWCVRGSCRAGGRGRS